MSNATLTNGNGNGTVNRIGGKASKSKASKSADARPDVNVNDRLFVNAVRALRGKPPLADDETPNAVEIADARETLDARNVARDDARNAALVNVAPIRKPGSRETRRRSKSRRNASRLRR